MRIRWEYLVLGLVIIGPPVVAQDAKSAGKSAVSNKEPKLTAPRKADENSGEQKFQQNCGRCHNTPEGFPSHISGTIVKHMRVRASLSEEDAREILRYLNPQ